MPERLTDLEAALRRLQPTSIAPGPALVEMGRASAAKSVRRWRAFSALATTVAVALALVVVLRPPVSRVQVVYLPAPRGAESQEVVDESEDEAPEGIEPSVVAWPFRQRLMNVTLETFPDDAVEPARRPLRAGDVNEFTKSGGW